MNEYSHTIGSTACSKQHNERKKFHLVTGRSARLSFLNFLGGHRGPVRLDVAPELIIYACLWPLADLSQLKRRVRN